MQHLNMLYFNYNYRLAFGGPEQRKGERCAELQEAGLLDNYNRGDCLHRNSGLPAFKSKERQEGRGLYFGIRSDLRLVYIVRPAIEGWYR